MSNLSISSLCHHVRESNYIRQYDATKEHLGLFTMQDLKVSKQNSTICFPSCHIWSAPAGLPWYTQQESLFITKSASMLIATATDPSKSNRTLS